MQVSINILTAPLTSPHTSIQKEMATVSWSAVIRAFSDKYDEVFGNTGRKAYFDFNRIKSKTTFATDNIIDV